MDNETATLLQEELEEAFSYIPDWTTWGRNPQWQANKIKITPENKRIESYYQIEVETTKGRFLLKEVLLLDNYEKSREEDE